MELMIVIVLSGSSESSFYNVVVGEICYIVFWVLDFLCATTLVGWFTKEVINEMHISSTNVVMNEMHISSIHAFLWSSKLDLLWLINWILQSCDLFGFCCILALCLELARFCSSSFVFFLVQTLTLCIDNAFCES